MRVSIEILAIGSRYNEWGDRQVAFRYELGTGIILQDGWLVESVNGGSLDILPSLLADYVNFTRPPSKINRWL